MQPTLGPGAVDGVFEVKVRIWDLLSSAGLMICTAVTFLGQSPASGPFGSLPAPSIEQTGAAPARPMHKTPLARQSYPAMAPYEPVDDRSGPDNNGSAYIPVDSWVYPAMTRLYSMGFLDSMFLGMRPWTRRSALHMLVQSENAIVTSDNIEAQGILDKLLHELRLELHDPRGAVYGVESGYTRLMGIGGSTLRDSYHLGQTISNDYGRPYQPGFNSVAGFSTLNEAGRFSLYVRGEYQHAPGGYGYSQTLGSLLSTNDQPVSNPSSAPQPTIPVGPIAGQNPFRLIEATASFHLLGHEISGGKQDAWLGPGSGGAMAWSNNAENIYSFRINRVEPLNIFLVSKLLGPLRYDFFVGSLKGHSLPNSPWAHADMFSFRPTVNFEFGFERTVIWGGEGHEPVTLHTFLHGFFDFHDTTEQEKMSRDDPGARYSNFNFSYRLPFVRKYATLYVDSIAHDDVTPVSAPRRAAYRTGLYLSRIPKLPKFDLRAEAVTTDPGVARSHSGSFNYFEVVQLQGYTNKGMIMGDWIGREAKGGQAWLTYHLSGNEWIQVEYLNKKTPKDFIPGGTTQNQFTVSVVKRFARGAEIKSWVQYEGWKAPIYKMGLQKNVTSTVQFTWYPQLHSSSERP
jgi:Capsule assembly protein Wzi